MHFFCISTRDRQKKEGVVNTTQKLTCKVKDRYKFDVVLRLPTLAKEISNEKHKSLRTYCVFFFFFLLM